MIYHAPTYYSTVDSFSGLVASIPANEKDFYYGFGPLLLSKTESGPSKTCRS